MEDSNFSEENYMRPPVREGVKVEKNVFKKTLSLTFFFT